MKSQEGHKIWRDTKTHIKTQKYTDISNCIEPEVSKIKLRFADRNSYKQQHKNFRHTSMLNRDEPKKKQINHLTQPSKKSIMKGKQLQRKLPEIYQVQVQPKSMKMINIDKYKRKQKVTSTGLVLQDPKEEKEDSQHRKIERKKMIKTKLTELNSLKQLNREEKNKIFKVIRGQFQDLINTTNQLTIKNPQYNFRAYVEKGNNGMLIKELLKKRWWWHISQKDPHKANLVWTQWLNRSITDKMQKKQGLQKTLYQQDYKQRQLDYVRTNKESSIHKIVDDRTFNKIQTKINYKSNNYFKINKGVSESLGDFCQTEDIKNIKIQSNQVIHNHVDGCLELHSKKLLFKNIYNFMKKKQWNPFQFIPLTFYINRKDSPIVQEFLQTYDALAKQNEPNKNIWICKPGQNSNRGYGIKVLKERHQIQRQIQERLSQNTQNFERRTVIFQKYIQNCFLIKNRKFDIRCYVLLTTVNGILKGYWYRDGYIRTSSEEYDLNDLKNVMIHLTNDAVQKKGQSFGKYEDYNKMTFEGFKQYLQRSTNINKNKFDDTYEQMKLIAYYMIVSVSTKIQRKQFTFQLFGLDYMLDTNLKPYLIEANSNPCLQSNGIIMGSLIRHLVQNVIMTAIDPIFPPPSNIKKPTEYITKDYFESNRLQLIFTGR